ncbi:MAG: redox-sensing transcriptional repressor Rex [Alphaproteobacteria bacterium]|nr:redox-sensing transcriptional repressor Rex [Alphaproteobacteria bacterium]
MAETNHIKRLNKIPSIRRLPRYLKCLNDFEKQGRDVVSSTELSSTLKWLPIVVKKDLQIVTPPTQKRTGYKVHGTILAIEHFLGWNHPMPTILVGVGNLGAALLNYGKFQGLEFKAAFDVKNEGQDTNAVPFHLMTDLPDFLSKQKIDVAVITTPEDVAQETANLLISLGIKALWNFTSKRISVPDDVLLQREDLSAGLAELCAKIHHIKGVEETSLSE